MEDMSIVSVLTLSGGSGGGGGGTTKTSVANTAYEVGGIGKNEDLTDMTATQVINKIFNKKDEPTISFTLPSKWNYEKGEELEDLLIRVKAVRSQSDLTKIELYIDGGLVYTFTSGVSSGGTFDYTHNEIIKKDTTILAKLYYSGNPLAPISTTKKIQFLNNAYYGISSTASLNSDMIKGGVSSLCIGKSASLSFTGTNCHLWYAYPSSYGSITKIIDGSGINYTASFMSTSVDIDDVSYNVYVLNDKTTVSNFKLSFS